jgi:hypothetical protein
MGRPKAIIDWENVGEMLRCGADVRSIASSLGISPDTLYVRSKRDNKVDFSAFSQQKKAQGNDLLRRKQFEVAMTGNVSMLIWLGKNRLGQTDRQAISAEIKGAEVTDKLMSLLLRSKRVYEVFKIDPPGTLFDPENQEHRDGLKKCVASAIKVQTRLLDPMEADLFDGWEERLDQWEKSGFQEMSGSKLELEV